MTFRSNIAFWSLFLAIIIGAFALRSWNIQNLPAGLYPDEAMNAMDAIRANETGHYLFFYPNNNGREGLFINLQALALRWFGNNVPALKLWSEIFGTLAVLGIGLLAWELFRRRLAALISAFLTATAYWAINFSRTGFRAIMLPFILSFILFFLSRGLRTQKLWPFLLSGILFGIGFHTYIAFRAAPLIFILLLPFLLLAYPSFLKRYWKHIVAFIVPAAFFAAPMLWTFISHPDLFASRSASLSIFSPQVMHGKPLLTFIEALAFSLGKYNFLGDQNWRHNYVPYPILDPFIGYFFLIGLIFSVGQIVGLVMQWRITKTCDPKISLYALLVIGFFCMLAPEFLTTDGLPHALRSIGTQPFVFLFATMPLVFLYDQAMRMKDTKKRVLIAFIAITLFGSALWNITKYYVFFANNPRQHLAFDANYANMAKYLISLPPDVHKYVLANTDEKNEDNGLPITAQSLAFLTYGKVQNLEFFSPKTSIKLPAVFIPLIYDPKYLEALKTKEPQAHADLMDFNPGYGSAFIAITIPSPALPNVP